MKIGRKTILETFENEQTPLEVNTLTHREPMQVYDVRRKVLKP